MRQYAEENGFGKHPTMNLVASYFGEKIVISSEMASLYLKLGFNISEVTEVSVRIRPDPPPPPLQPASAHPVQTDFFPTFPPSHPTSR